MKQIIFALAILVLSPHSRAEDGYRLWLRYDKIDNNKVLQEYRNTITAIHFYSSSPTFIAARTELINGLQGLLDKKINDFPTIHNGFVLAGLTNHPTIKTMIVGTDINALGNEGFIIRSIKKNEINGIVISANTDAGVLYGVFQFLRLLQTQQNIQQLSIISVPKIQTRILNHWDNLNRTVERGYAGISIWNWHTLPDYIDQRYIDYARANASIGINGTVLTNVNANALVLTEEYLLKVAALANVFRPYGIKVYLTARFSSPIEIGGLKTSDPLNTDVANWWKQKINEIYQYIPDFGGFLVKANSEGQPGPQNYGRTHSDGANMFADALAVHGGIVMWRAFVYSNEVPDDRVKQATNEFQPLDGKFRKNVFVQVKNGPLDFQPREPFHPLFGAMPQTPLMMEFQLTQEYLGQGTHLVYQVPLFKETLDADTYIKGKGTFVRNIIDGTLEDHSVSGIAGVANTGNERNWTNHPFGQANWYGFGRLSWNYELTSIQIADEWIKQTFSNKKQVVGTIEQMMMASREAVVNYMTPLGLHHIMGTGHHYGPAPWVSTAGRADWNPVYYHRADSIGIGFDRTENGSNAIAQYNAEVGKQWNNLNDEKYLLWFHHVPWTYKLQSGRTLWDELCIKYQSGVDTVRWMQKQWNSLKDMIDTERYHQVKMFLALQEKEAVWWRNACLLYFQTFSNMPMPPGYEKPDHTLEFYKIQKFRYAPGNAG
jgi:alpha-glucuronidase